MKYTKHALQKLETLFSEMGYTIRYEKGNFQSGYCLVESKPIAVVNKFFETEARINCLIEILSTLEVPVEQLSEASRKLFQEIQKHAEAANPD